jgi:hypothetical protein
MTQTTDPKLTRFIGLEVTTPTGYTGTIIGFVDDLDGNTHVVVHWTDCDGGPANFVDTTDIEDLNVSLKEVLS